MTDELGPYSKWLVAVAAAAKECQRLRREIARPRVATKDAFPEAEFYALQSATIALDAALDAEPKE